jgi:hypothetical protein
MNQLASLEHSIRRQSTPLCVLVCMLRIDELENLHVPSPLWPFLLSQVNFNLPLLRPSLLSSRPKSISFPSLLSLMPVPLLSVLSSCPKSVSLASFLSLVSVPLLSVISSCSSLYMLKDFHQLFLVRRPGNRDTRLLAHSTALAGLSARRSLLLNLVHVKHYKAAKRLTLSPAERIHCISSFG